MGFSSFHHQNKGTGSWYSATKLYKMLGRPRQYAKHIILAAIVRKKQPYGFTMVSLWFYYGFIGMIMG